MHIALQVRVLGLKHGAWGVERYGNRPMKVDALEFYPAKLAELLRLMAERQAAARSSFVPTAFVTFKTRRAQVGGMRRSGQPGLRGAIVLPLRYH